MPDHLGWRLWLANRQWQARFVEAMRAAGHDWFTDARANLLGNIARGGTPQAVVIARMGISKQAVQQLIDGLQGEGILERAPDPKDSRSRIVRHIPQPRCRSVRDIDAGFEIDDRRGQRRGVTASGDVPPLRRIATFSRASP